MTNVIYSPFHLKGRKILNQSGLVMFDATDCDDIRKGEIVGGKSYFGRIAIKKALTASESLVCLCSLAGEEYHRLMMQARGECALLALDCKTMHQIKNGEVKHDVN